MDAKKVSLQTELLSLVEKELGFAIVDDTMHAIVFDREGHVCYTNAYIPLHFYTELRDFHVKALEQQCLDEIKITSPYMDMVYFSLPGTSYCAFVIFKL